MDSDNDAAGERIAQAIEKHAADWAASVPDVHGQSRPTEWYVMRAFQAAAIIARAGGEVQP